MPEVINCQPEILTRSISPLTLRLWICDYNYDRVLAFPECRNQSWASVIFGHGENLLFPDFAVRGNVSATGVIKGK